MSEENPSGQPIPSTPPAPTEVVDFLPAMEQPGDWIGPYKLLQQIGEGGCGVVYMAEQEQPVRRRVALKVIKLGMDTRQVIARFEAERQALAMMDHPNIAKVLDAGATATGRPYFVMELVRGVKFTDYCDQNHISTRARLELFILVCQAIQHAHQKAIIHRDIKPSNILVTLHDGVPVPKVIDFGIAKAAAGQRLTDKTLFTAFEQFMGTPAYMSPEQAEMSGLDIDTRSDIYSLGVLLFELVTGTTPFDGHALVASGLDAMRRTIREQEPPKPSTRLSDMLDAELETAARQRGADAPRLLLHSVRGDLDWIVMKTLEKDRVRRYETANGLALDVRRFLDNEPISARPPSNLYRLQKTIRRNKLAFAAAAAVMLSLVLALLISIFFYTRETRAKIQAHSMAEQSQKVVNDIVGLAEKVGDPDQDFLAASEGAVPPKELNLSLIDSAVEHYEAYLTGAPGNPALKATLARLYQRQARIYRLQAMSDLRRVAEMGPQTVSPRKEKLETKARGENQTAALSLEKSHSLYNELDATFPGVPAYREGLAAFYSDLAETLPDHDAAADALQKALAIREDLLKKQPNDATQQAAIADLLAQLARTRSDTADIRQLTEREMKIREDIAQNHSLDPLAQSNASVKLADVYGRAAALSGNGADSIAILKKAISLMESHQAEFLVTGKGANPKPADFENLFQLARFQSELSRRLTQSGATAEAVGAAQAGLQTANFIVANNPNAQLTLVTAYTDLSDAARAASRTEDSIAAGHLAMETLQALGQKGRTQVGPISMHETQVHDVGVELDALCDRIVNQWLEKSNVVAALQAARAASNYFALRAESGVEWSELALGADLRMLNLTRHLESNAAPRLVADTARLANDLAEHDPARLVALAKILAVRANPPGSASGVQRALNDASAEQAIEVLRLAAAVTNYSFPSKEFDSAELGLLASRADFAGVKRDWSRRQASPGPGASGVTSVRDVAAIRSAQADRRSIRLSGMVDKSYWTSDHQVLIITFAGVPEKEFVAALPVANQNPFLAKLGGDLTEALGNGASLEFEGQPDYHYSQLQVRLQIVNQITAVVPAARPPHGLASSADSPNAGLRVPGPADAVAPSAPGLARLAPPGAFMAGDTAGLNRQANREVTVVGTIFAIERLRGGSLRVVFEEAPTGGFVGFARPEHTLAIADALAAKLPHPRGQAVQISGPVMLYHGSPEIILTNAVQISALGTLLEAEK